MNIIRPNWSAPPNIHAISTTRLSLSSGLTGAGSTVYDYCNLGAHVGDKAELVKANRKELVEKYNIPSSPIWLEQTHSTELVELSSMAVRDAIDGVVKEESALSGDGPLHNADGPPLKTDGSLFKADGSLFKADGSLFKADGSLTREQDVVCTVMTADCLPLLLCDAHGTRVAAVHAGWRGMADGIIENAVSQFDCQVEDIIAWAGPCIGPSKFEIGLEVKQQLGGESSHYQEISKGKVLANLYAICGSKLAALGVKNYSHSSACTFSDPSQFYSYRRDGQCGRMASIIWIGGST